MASLDRPYDQQSLNMQASALLGSDAFFVETFGALPTACPTRLCSEGGYVLEGRDRSPGCDCRHTSSAG